MAFSPNVNSEVQKNSLLCHASAPSIGLSGILSSLLSRKHPSGSSGRHIGRGVAIGETEGVKLGEISGEGVHEAGIASGAGIFGR